VSHRILYCSSWTDINFFQLPLIIPLGILFLHMGFGNFGYLAKRGFLTHHLTPVIKCCTEPFTYLRSIFYSFILANLAFPTRLHRHAIFGVVSVSDTCRTPERVRLAGFRCPVSVLFFFFFFFVSPTRVDTAPTWLRRVRHASSEEKKNHRF